MPMSVDRAVLERRFLGRPDTVPGMFGFYLHLHKLVGHPIQFPV